MCVEGEEYNGPDQKMERRCGVGNSKGEGNCEIVYLKNRMEKSYHHQNYSAMWVFVLQHSRGKKRKMSSEPRIVLLATPATIRAFLTGCSANLTCLSISNGNLQI